MVMALYTEQIVRRATWSMIVRGSRRLRAIRDRAQNRPVGWRGRQGAIDLQGGSWEVYTSGIPLAPSKFTVAQWTDRETRPVPVLRKAVQGGYSTHDLHHKGLLPPEYETTSPTVGNYATVDDVGKAAKDWTQMKLVIYH